MSTQVAPSYDAQGPYFEPAPAKPDLISLNNFEPSRTEVLPAIQNYQQAFDASENAKSPTTNAQVYSAEPTLVEVPVMVEKPTLDLKGAALFLLIGFISFKIFKKGK